MTETYITVNLKSPHCTSVCTYTTDGGIVLESKVKGVFFIWYLPGICSPPKNSKLLQCKDKFKAESNLPSDTSCLRDPFKSCGSWVLQEPFPDDFHEQGALLWLRFVGSPSRWTESGEAETRQPGIGIATVIVGSFRFCVHWRDKTPRGKYLALAVLEHLQGLLHLSFVVAQLAQMIAGCQVF